jgi:recombination protein RecR
VVSPVIEPVARLIEAFARLPGIGPKTAQRLTFHLLRAPDAEARTLAAALIAVRDQVVFCDRCFNISDQPLCPICRDPGRDATRLCVVEEPLDVLALERTGEFKGQYHVLHGAISPIDGIGPDRLRIRELLERADAASRDGAPFVEVIMATNPTLEGEATAMYLAERLEPVVGVVSRIARGLPVGGDLEYADEVTLIRALQGRGPWRPSHEQPVIEILIRLAKAGCALIGAVLYLLLVGPFGATGTVEPPCCAVERGRLRPARGDEPDLRRLTGDRASITFVAPPPGGRLGRAAGRSAPAV